MRTRTISPAHRLGQAPSRILGAETARQRLRQNVRFRRLVDRLHALGPRPVGELLLVTARDLDELLDELERLARWDAATVAALGARDWPPAPLREVAA